MLQNKDRIEYLSLEELFNSMEKGQVFEVDDLVQQEELNKSKKSIDDLEILKDRIFFMQLYLWQRS